MMWKLIFILGLLCAGVMAESTLRAKGRASNVQTSLYGNVELRPQISTIDAGFASENTVEVGAKFKANLTAGYQQEINTNSSTLEENPGSVVFGDGFLRLKLDDMYQSPDKMTSLSYETRWYFPTDATKREASMVGILRNYLKVARKINDTVSFRFFEVPIIHLYSDAESETTLKANPVFENRMILSLDMNLSKAVTLSIPVHYYITKYRDSDVAGVSNGGEWNPNLFFWPELTYTMTPAVYIGAAYRTDSLVQSSEDGVVAGDHFGGGVFQGILGVNF